MRFSKNLLRSKTFWFNVLSGVASYSGFLPVDPQTALIVSNAANIGLRVITKGPVHVLNDAANEP